MSEGLGCLIKAGDPWPPLPGGGLLLSIETEVQNNAQETWYLPSPWAEWGTQRKECSLSLTPTPTLGAVGIPRA